MVTKENWMESDPATYVAMLEDMDSEVGRLLAAIDDAGLREKTVVIFVSDNGGLKGTANMAPLRGAKGTTLEGGIRVPLIIRWPGRIEAETRSEQVSATFDLTRSILKLAGAGVPSERLDGYDIIGHVAEGREDFERTLFWRGRRGDRTWAAVRDSDLKYIRLIEGERTEEWMYNLSTDIHEENDLLGSRSDDGDRLKSLLAKWEADMKPAR